MERRGLSLLSLVMGCFFVAACTSPPEADPASPALKGGDYTELIGKLSSLDPNQRASACASVVVEREFLAKEMQTEVEAVVLPVLGICLQDSHWVPRRIAASQMLELRREMDLRPLLPHLVARLDASSPPQFHEDGGTLAIALATIGPKKATSLFAEMLTSNELEAVLCAAAGVEFLEPTVPALYDQIERRLQVLRDAEDASLYVPVLEEVLKSRSKPTKQ